MYIYIYTDFQKKSIKKNSGRRQLQFSAGAAVLYILNFFDFLKNQKKDFLKD